MSIWGNMGSFVHIFSFTYRAHRLDVQAMCPICTMCKRKNVDPNLNLCKVFTFRVFRFSGRQELEIW